MYVKGRHPVRPLPIVTVCMADEYVPSVLPSIVVTRDTGLSPADRDMLPENVHSSAMTPQTRRFLSVEHPLRGAFNCPGSELAQMTSPPHSGRRGSVHPDDVYGKGHSKAERTSTPFSCRYNTVNRTQPKKEVTSNRKDVIRVGRHTDDNSESSTVSYKSSHDNVFWNRFRVASRVGCSRRADCRPVNVDLLVKGTGARENKVDTVVDFERNIMNMNNVPCMASDSSSRSTECGHLTGDEAGPNKDMLHVNADAETQQNENSNANRPITVSDLDGGGGNCGGGSVKNSDVSAGEYRQSQTDEDDTDSDGDDDADEDESDEGQDCEWRLADAASPRPSGNVVSSKSPRSCPCTSTEVIRVDIKMHPTQEDDKGGCAVNTSIDTADEAGDSPTSSSKLPCEMKSPLDLSESDIITETFDLHFVPSDIDVVAPPLPIDPGEVSPTPAGRSLGRSRSEGSTAAAREHKSNIPVPSARHAATKAKRAGEDIARSRVARSYRPRRSDSSPCQKAAVLSLRSNGRATSVAATTRATRRFGQSWPGSAPTNRDGGDAAKRSRRPSKPTTNATSPSSALSQSCDSNSPNQLTLVRTRFKEAVVTKPAEVLFTICGNVNSDSTVTRLGRVPVVQCAPPVRRMQQGDDLTRSRLKCEAYCHGDGKMQVRHCLICNHHHRQHQRRHQHHHHHHHSHHHHHHHQRRHQHHQQTQHRRP